MNHKALRITQITLLAVAAVMIVLGIFWGEAFDVFRKAVTICLECIGIG